MRLAVDRDPVRRRGWHLTAARREAIEGYLWILPWLIGLVVFVAGPIVASLVLSFTNYQLLQAPVFTGLSNYITLFHDSLFWQSLKVTAIYVAVATPLALALSFLVAVMLNQNIRFVGLWRTLFYIPNLVPAIASAMLWLWLLDPQFGLVNSALRVVHIQGPAWLGSEYWVLPSLIVVSIWSAIGAPMLIYLAGLQGIAAELYEAVACDGGGAFAKFRHITIPMMTPVIFYNLIVNMITAFQAFSGPYLLTSGGPANASLLYVLYIYQNAFQYYRMGYASALSWILLLIILGLTLLIFRWSSIWVYYEDSRGAT